VRYEEEGDCPTREIIRYAAALTRTGVTEFFEFEYEILSFCGVAVAPSLLVTTSESDRWIDKTRRAEGGRVVGDDVSLASGQVQWSWRCVHLLEVHV
jgi:hypothetical protein